MSRIQALLFLMLALAPFASAQFPLFVGVKAGVPLTNSFEGINAFSVYDPNDPGSIHGMRSNGSTYTSSKSYLDQVEFLVGFSF